MISYYSLLKDSESDLVATFQITDNNSGLPNGTYALFPFYCEYPYCDCRETKVEIIQTEKSANGQTKIVGEVLAYIDYGWDSPEFYRERAKKTGSATYFPGVYLDTEISTSEYAETLLALFTNLILQNEDLSLKLEEQYYDFKFKLKQRIKNAPAPIVSLPASFQPASFLPSLRKKRIKLR